MTDDQAAGVGRRELRPDLLRTYLNDHLAALVATRQLAQRVAKSQAGMPLGRELDLLAVQIGEDRDALLLVMRSLDIPARRTATWVGRVAEKTGRLKPNGRLVRSTPLSAVTELEALRLGILHSAQAWSTLSRLARYDPRLDPDRLTALQHDAEHRADVADGARVAASIRLTLVTA